MTSVNMLSEKSIATPDCLAPYLVLVATKEYCSMCLEMGLISEEICMEILVVLLAAEEQRGRIYTRGAVS